MGDEGCFYVIKYNWKIAQLYIRKSTIIQKITVSKILSTLDNFGINISHLDKLLYDQ